MKLTLTTAGLLASALTLASVPDARADVRVGVGIRIDAGHYDSRGAWRYGYDRGVHEGLREGERDARRNERFGYRDEGRYRDGGRGYKGWMGPRFEYEGGYRRGFVEGYARAYRRFAGYDRYDRYDRDRYDYDRDERYDRRERW